MAYTTESNRLIHLMLDESLPRNHSQCRDCRLFQAVNAYYGSCQHRPVVLASDPTCYQAEVGQSPALAREAQADYGNVPPEQLTHAESRLDRLGQPDDFEAPDYPLTTWTDETLDEMAAELDREELADLAREIDQFLKLSGRADREQDPVDLAELKVEKSKVLLNIQKQMVSLAIDMGLQITPELYQRLYGKTLA